MNENINRTIGYQTQDVVHFQIWNECLEISSPLLKLPVLSSKRRETGKEFGLYETSQLMAGVSMSEKNCNE